MFLPNPEPLEAVINRFYAPSQPRAGDRSARLWWCCPFHDDANPSLCVKPGEARYKCFGCGVSGDAIDFVRRLNPSMNFREAVAALGGESAPPRAGPRPRPSPRATPASRPDAWPAFARGVIERAGAALWSERGSRARDYLHGRGLADATIRAARLGFQQDAANAAGIFPGSNVWLPRGIVIPWLEDDEVTVVNIRRPRDEPKYWAVKGSRRGGIYPSRGVIAAGLPLVLVEGEFDALLLGQELAGLASVVTLGTAGDKPKPAALNAMLVARPWLVAYDADAAGETSAGHWLALSDRCRRVLPPAGKDWTDAYQAGVDLRAWWAEILVPEAPSARVPEAGRGGSPAGIIPEPPWRPPAWWVLAVFDLLEGWVEVFEERAAIMEFDGGLNREEAERWAVGCVS